MSGHSLAVVVLSLCLLSATSSEVRAQAAPPVDQAEGGGADNQLRVGPAVISGSAWLESNLPLQASRQEGRDVFRVRRGRLGIAGTFNPRLGYSFSTELSSRPSVRNAFLVLRVTDYVSVRVGQANPMASVERGTSPLSLELIDRSVVTTILTGPSDIGVTIFNPEPYRDWLGYALNVTNGAGFNRADNNGSKDVSGRIALSPVSLAGLRMVISGARGEQPGGLRTRVGLGVDYRRAAWHVLVEGLRQRRDNLPASDGYVAMVAYRYRPKAPRAGFAHVEFAARVSVLNDRATAAGVSSDILNDDGGGPSPPEAGIVTMRELQAGVSYAFTSNVRVMGNLVAPFDDRSEAGPRALLRWQFQF